MSEETKIHQDQLQFLKSLDEVNKAFLGTSDLQQMMCDVLDAVLSVFDCDRAFLLSPCDPEASSWTSPMERTKAEYPGALALNLEIAMDAEVAETLRVLLESDGPVSFGPESEYELPSAAAEQFNIKSYIGMAIYPKLGKPWQFGIHQCSYERVWSWSEKQLFGIIGQRIADSLSVLLSFEELSENREFLDNIVENIPDMVFVKDAKELRFIRLNKAGERLLGYSQQELLGKNDYDFFTKEEADFFTATDREVLDRNELVDIPEESIHTKYGERFLHTKKIPLCNKAGNPTYLLGISKDITERKQMFEALQRSEERLQLAAETAQMGLWDWNIITGDIIWSDQCKALCGLSAETAMSYELFLQTLHSDDRDYVEAALNRAVEERTGYDVTKRTVWPDGSQHWTNSRAQVHCDSTGKPVRMVGVAFDVTERKQMEQALVMREREFRTLAENSPDNIARYDINCRTVYANPALVNTLGRPESEILGNTPIERASLDQHWEYQEKISEVLQTGKDVEMDLFVPDIGEGEHYYNIRFVAERGADGTISGVLAIGRDVTERKVYEAKLQESERRFRTLVDHAADAFFLHDEGGEILDVNYQACQSLGYSREELIGMKPYDFDVGREHSFIKQMEARLSAGEVVEFKTRHRRKDGSEFSVEVRTQSLRQGERNLAVSLARDITERKRVEEKLRNLSQAIEQSPVSIVITDLSGRIEFVNTTFTQVTGYSYAEAMGQHTRRLKSGETTAEEYRQLWKTISSGGVWQGEIHNRKKNGQLFWEHVTIAPIRNADNVISHYVAVKEDITERKKLEEQLRQSQKMEAIGQLAGGVAHDFNNMLGVIMGYTELSLKKTTKDNPLHKNLEQIKKAGQRSTEITRQLLAFARKQTIAPVILNLDETVEGMLKLLRRLIGEDIDLSWQPGAELWPVKMDPSQIDQILANLCVNARDAIAGVGKVTIETHKADFDEAYCEQHKGFHPGEFVMLAVSDNGIGMDKPTMDKIFEPFFTTKGIGSGTGLGLATVYGIVKQNAGFINVYSEVECGSTFKIYLPRYAKMVGQKPKAGPEPQDLSGNETILLVEDEIEHLKMVKLMLESYGYQVLAASSPSEALLVAKGHTGIDLLLSDVIMPEMNGLDLAKKIISLSPDIRSLFMSGYTHNVIIRHGALKEGVNFIQKPFSNLDLVTKVREVLDSW